MARRLAFAALGLLALETAGARAEPLTLDSTVRLTGLYDSNILRSPSSTALAPGLSRSDLRYDGTLGFVLHKDVSAQELYAAVRGTTQRYLNNRSFNNDGFDVNGGALWTVGDACAGIAEGKILRQESFVEDILRVAPNQSTSKSVMSRGGCDFAQKYRANYDVRYLTVSNSDPVVALSSRRELRTVGSLAYLFPVRSFLGVEVGRIKQKYPNRTALLLPGVAPSTEELDAAIVFRRTLSVKTAITGRAGIAHLRVPSATSRSRTSGNFQIFTVAASWQATSKLNVILSGRRSIDPSSQVTSYTLAEGTDLTATYALNSTVNLNALFGYRSVDFVGSARFNRAAADQHTDYLRMGGGVDVALSERWSMRANYLHYTADSNLRTAEFGSDSLNLQLEAHF